MVKFEMTPRKIGRNISAQSSPSTKMPQIVTGGSWLGFPKIPKWKSYIMFAFENEGFPWKEKPMEILANPSNIESKNNETL